MTSPPDPSYRAPRPGTRLGGGKLILGVATAGACLIAAVVTVGFLLDPLDETERAATDARHGPSAADRPPDAEPDGGPPVDFDIGGDGVYLVGEDIEAGDYTATVPAESGLCYWERLDDTDGAFDDIIANGVAETGELVTVTVEKRDTAFRSQGCGGWTKG